MSENMRRRQAVNAFINARAEQLKRMSEAIAKAPYYSRPEAGDLVSQLCVALHQKPEMVERMNTWPEEGIQAYCYRWMLTILAQSIRKTRHEVHGEEFMGDLARTIARMTVLGHEVEMVIPLEIAELLSPAERETLFMKVWLSMSYMDIAKHTDRKESAVRKIWSRILAKLRRHKDKVLAVLQSK